MKEKIKALSDHLCIDESSIQDLEGGAFGWNEQKYLVLTDEEARAKAIEYISETLWAFNAEFLCDWMPVTECLTQTSYDLFVSEIKWMQSKLSEDCNEIISALLGDSKIDCIEDAMDCDGIAHFLSSYDGHEHEVDNYFIYRTN